MTIDTSTLTKQEKLALLADLKMDVFQARKTVRVWETPEHPFWPGRFCEGLIIAVDQQPYTILRIVRGYDSWAVHLADPDEEELHWYATRKERDICPTCGYSEDRKREEIKALNSEMVLKVHMLLHEDCSEEVAGILFDEIRTIDSKLWRRSAEEEASMHEQSGNRLIGIRDAREREYDE